MENEAYFAIGLSSAIILIFPELWVLTRLIIRSRAKTDKRVEPSDNEISIDVFVPILVPDDWQYLNKAITRNQKDRASSQHIFFVLNGKNIEKYETPKSSSNVSFLKSNLEGKADSLNYATEFGTSKIVGFFDCDTVRVTSGRKALSPLASGQIGCIQGLNIWISPGSSTLLSSMVTLESVASAFNSVVFSKGNHSVSQFRGSNAYWRRDIISALKFDGSFLLEDIDLTIRYLVGGGKITFDPELVAIEEVPKGIYGWIRQRTRWSAGWGEILLRRSALVLRSTKLHFSQKFAIAGYPLWYGLLAPVSFSSVSYLALSGYFFGLMTVFLVRLAHLYLAFKLISGRREFSNLMNSKFGSATFPMLFCYPIYSMLLDLLRVFAFLRLIGFRFRWQPTSKAFSNNEHSK